MLVRSTRFIPAIFAAGICAMTTDTASSETLSRSISYFTIEGTTALEIEQQLLKLGPLIGRTGRRHPGATRLEFTSRITYSKTDTRCRIAAASVAIKAEVFLPRWRRAADADTGAKLYWDAVSADIVRHEESHLVIARNHARELERGLPKLSSAADCDLMADRAKAFQTTVLARHDTEQARFDRVEGMTLDKRLLGKLKRRVDQMRGRSTEPVQKRN